MTVVSKSAELGQGGPWPELSFTYTNYKMETEARRVRPNYWWFGCSAYHRGDQWFLNALDLDKNEERNFAARDMRAVTVLRRRPEPTDVSRETSVSKPDL